MAYLEQNCLKDKIFLEKVQQRAARFILNDSNHEDIVSKMLDDLQWEPLEVICTGLRVIAICTNVYEITTS